MEKEELQKEYDLRYVDFDKLGNEIKFSLEELLRKDKIKVHYVLSRVKDFNSFYEKALRKESKEPFKDITDVVGVRVVCLLNSDIVKITEIIRSNFSVISEDNKAENTDLTSFGYLSFHFIVQIKNEYKGIRYDSIKGLMAEIQVRTLAMDAWATISHYLDYKQEIDIPKYLRKDFYALSGLFYVADTHFEMVFKERQKSLMNAKKTIVSRFPNFNQEINFDTLSAYLHWKLPKRRFYKKYASELVKELLDNGYTEIIQLEEAFRVGFQAFVDLEKTEYQNELETFSSIAVVRILLSIVDSKYTYDDGAPGGKDPLYVKYRRKFHINKPKKS